LPQKEIADQRLARGIHKVVYIIQEGICAQPLAGNPSLGLRGCEESPVVGGKTLTHTRGV